MPLPLPLVFRRLLPWLGIFAAAASLGAQTPSPPPPAKPAAAKAKAPRPVEMVPTGYELREAFPGLKFEQPLGIVSVPGDRTRLFVVEKTGRIRVVTGLAGAQPEQETFLDLTRPRDGELELASECGVLGLAFPPDHARSGRFFVYYSLKIGGALHQRVSRFQIQKGNPHRGDEASEQPLITQADAANNHNGGDLQFGPDGYLYISVGDGGSGGDKLDQGRFIDQGFHAGILRIDVDKRAGNLPPNPHPAIALAPNGSAFYAVPKDNPFVRRASHHGQALDPKKVRTEFWATGLRNPWRIAFDPATGRLFAGDIGQNRFEEVNIIVKGGDYGWSYREASQPFVTGPGKEAEPPGFKPIDPIFEYPRTVGLSVTGGAVYHGRRYPHLKGTYIFGDYITGRVIALRDTGEAVWTDETLAQEPGISGIGIDPRDGEVLFANLGLGTLKQLHPKAAAAPSP